MEDEIENVIRGYLEELATSRQFITFRQLRYDLCDVGFEEFNPSRLESVANLEAYVREVEKTHFVTGEEISLTIVIISSLGEAQPEEQYEPYLKSGFRFPKTASKLEMIRAWKAAIAALWEAYGASDLKDHDAHLAWVARKNVLAEGRAIRLQREADQVTEYERRFTGKIRGLSEEDFEIDSSNPTELPRVRMPFAHYNSHGGEKIEYESFEDANSAAIEFAQKLHERGEEAVFNPYPCQLGQHFHIGNADYF
jgi:hypothetical protein